MKQDRALLPSKALSISLCVGKGVFLSRAYMDITIPGVQNPHWDPWHLAILSLWNTKQQIKTTWLTDVYIQAAAGPSLKGLGHNLF